MFNTRSSHIKDSKRYYLILPCLSLSIIRYISRVKWSYPGKGVAPSPTLRCSSYWKGSLWVALDYGCQLYFNWAIGLMNRVFVNRSGRPRFNPWSNHTKDSKMVLDATLLNAQYYKVRIKGKVEKSKEWSSTLPYTLV